MATTDYATSYEHKTTVTESSYTTTTSSGIIDRQFIRGVPAILKLLEGIFTILGFLLVVTSVLYCVSVGFSGFFNFAMMFAFFTTLLLYLLRLFKLQTRIFRCDCIFWPLIELVYYVVVIIILIIADIILSSVACTNQLKAGVAFGWFALGVYGVDLGFTVHLFRTSRYSHSEATTTQESSTTTSVRY